MNKKTKLRRQEKLHEVKSFLETLLAHSGPKNSNIRYVSGVSALTRNIFTNRKAVLEALLELQDNFILVSCGKARRINDPEILRSAGTYPWTLSSTVVHAFDLKEFKGFCSAYIRALKRKQD